MGSSETLITGGASLGSISLDFDPKSMICRIEDIKNRYSYLIHNKAYESVFCSFDTDGNPVLTGSIGRYAGFRVSVCRKAVTGEIDLDGAVVYCCRREADSEGFGTVPFDKVFEVCGELKERLSSMMEPGFSCVPFLGGIRSVMISDDEQVMADYSLPEIELFYKEGSGRLFTAPHIPADIDISPSGSAYPGPGFSCRISSRTEHPDRAEYRANMTRVLERLKSDYVQKVVVSRSRTFAPDEGFSLAAYASYLYDRYFQEYFYIFRQGDGSYWTGITPEIIFKQKGRYAVTKPLAGTRRKSDDPAENEEIKKDLTTAAKDSIEHEHALNFMVKELEESGIGKVSVGRTKSVLETPYAFHMKSEISVELREGISCFGLIGAIYPPATVWGIPVDRTEGILKEAEPFDRQYFTGVYGYWDMDGNSDTALVIRSARWDGKTVSLYAGGGIVKYSDIDSEFDETVNKMSPLMSCFYEE